MNAPLHSNDAKQAAIEDYYTSGDICSVVASRHGIPRSTLAGWARRADRDDLAYYGGWENRGGVLYPVTPERRSA